MNREFELLEISESVGYNVESDHILKRERESLETLDRSSETTPFVMTPVFYPRVLIELELMLQKRARLSSTSIIAALLR